MAECYHCVMSAARATTTIRLNGEEQQLLKELAEQTGESQNDVLRSALREKGARMGHAAKVRALFVEGEQQWAELLERLRVS